MDCALQMDLTVEVADLHEENCMCRGPDSYRDKDR